jgi:mitotic spindle assembly checkpoint protein MAD2
MCTIPGTERYIKETLTDIFGKNSKSSDLHSFFCVTSTQTFCGYDTKVSDRFSTKMCLGVTQKKRVYFFQIITRKIIIFLEPLSKNELTEIYMYIINDETKEAIEKWNFKIERENNDTTSSKDSKKIQGEIGAVMRQIMSIVSVLPELGSGYAITLGATFKKGCKFPEGWSDSDLHIEEAEEIKFRSFSTGLHKVEAEVAYKKVNEDS